MEKRVSLGRDHRDVERLETTLELGSKAMFDFHAVPICHPHQRPASLPGPVLDRAGPFTRSDFILKTSEWSSLIVGKVSDWIDLDHEDDEIRLLSEKALLQELDFAVHLSLPVVLISLKSKNCGNLARFLQEHLFLGPIQQIWIRVPMCCQRNSHGTSNGSSNSVTINGQLHDLNHFPSLGSSSPPNPRLSDPAHMTNGVNGSATEGLTTASDEAKHPLHSTSAVPSPTASHHCPAQAAVEDGGGGDYDPNEDTWEWWNILRTLCDTSKRINVCLEVTPDLPSEARILRWLGEPVKCAMLPTNIFLTNRKGFPVLAKSHQNLLKKFMKLQMQFLISGPTSTFAKEEICFFQYLEYLANSMVEGQDNVEKFAKGYEDYLQAPLQPLMDNLESQTYEVFEKDPIKYVTYEAAVKDALTDRVTEEKAVDQHQVVMVVGAGRGPLVRSVLSAAKAANRRVKIYAVEKNPNAVVTLQTLKREIWAEDDVTIVWHDMRTWEAPEKADILVSELLGSFSDNELSPECLDGAQKFLKADGISIPCKYTSYVAPLQSSKLYNEARSNKEREKHPLANYETPYVVRLHNCTVLAKPKPLFEFEHPNWGEIDNSRYGSLQFDIEESAVIHGFAGYFHTVLYKTHCLSIVPESYSVGMFSWFPIYFPIREPILIPKGSNVELHFWRRVDSHKVWYEWTLTKPVPIPIHNPKGRSYWIGL